MTVYSWEIHVYMGAFLKQTMFNYQRVSWILNLISSIVSVLDFMNIIDLPIDEPLNLLSSFVFLDQTCDFLRCSLPTTNNQSISIHIPITMLPYLLILSPSPNATLALLRACSLLEESGENWEAPFLHWTIHLFHVVEVIKTGRIWHGRLVYWGYFMGM